MLPDPPTFVKFDGGPQGGDSEKIQDITLVS